MIGTVLPSTSRQPRGTVPLINVSIARYNMTFFLLTHLPASDKGFLENTMRTYQDTDRGQRQPWFYRGVRLPGNSL